MSEARREIVDALQKIGKPAAPREVAELLGKDRQAVKRTMLNMRYSGGLDTNADLGIADALDGTIKRVAAIVAGPIKRAIGDNYSWEILPWAVSNRARRSLNNLAK